MSFASPFLLVLLVVPLAALAGYLWLERRPPRYVVTYPSVDVLALVAGRGRSWRRHLVAGLILLALSVLCVGLARPNVTLARPSERATVVLVVDVSVSMNARDVKPSRLEAARDAITEFVSRVPGEIRVALVSFSDSAEVITPPTTDRAQLQAGISSLVPGFGTAIGDAVARGVELARSATGEVPAVPDDGQSRPPSAVVLLSDGTQTRGLLTPDDGARRARRAGVPVYTIALGTLDGVVTITRDGFPATVPVPPDRATLARIAESTGGKAFDVTDAERLSAVYDQLGSVVGRERRPREVTVAFVAAGAALLAAGTLLAGLWSPRLP